jgi:hypothetical protein
MSKKAKVVDPYSLNEEDRRKFYEKEQQKALEQEEKRKKEEEKAKKKEWEKQSAKRKKEEEKAKRKEAKGTKKDKKGKDEPLVGRVIGTPTNFKREMHIGFNPESGMFEVRSLFPLLLPHTTTTTFITRSWLVPHGLCLVLLWSVCVRFLRFRSLAFPNGWRDDRQLRRAIGPLGSLVLRPLEFVCSVIICCWVGWLFSLAWWVAALVLLGSIPYTLLSHSHSPTLASSLVFVTHKGVGMRRCCGHMIGHSTRVEGDVGSSWSVGPGNR